MTPKHFIMLACIFGMSAGLHAESEEPGGLQSRLSAGFTLNDGNTDSMLANAALLTEGEKEGSGSVRLGAEGNYGENTVDEVSETTVKNAKGFATVKKTLSHLTFLSADSSVLYDHIAEIDFRALLGLSPGFYAVKTHQTKLSCELGAAYIWEKVSHVRDAYPALRVAQRLSHDFSETARVWQSVEYLPKATDFNQFLLQSELGAEAALNAHVSLRAVLQNRYDSEPGEDLERNDVALISGLSVQF